MVDMGLEEVGWGLWDVGRVREVGGLGGGGGCGGGWEGWECSDGLSANIYIYIYIEREREKARERERHPIPLARAPHVSTSLTEVWGASERCRDRERLISVKANKSSSAFRLNPEPLRSTTPRLT